MVIPGPTDARLPGSGVARSDHGHTDNGLEVAISRFHTTLTGCMQAVDRGHPVSGRHDAG
jgi:hypothetical protein